MELIIWKSRPSWANINNNILGYKLISLQIKMIENDFDKIVHNYITDT